MNASLAERFGIKTPARGHRDISAEDLTEYVGRYRAGLYAIEVGTDAQGLWLEAQRVGGMDAHQRPRPAPLPRMRLDLTAPDQALIRNGPFARLPVLFVRDQQRVRWVRFYGRLTPRI